MNPLSRDLNNRLLSETLLSVTVEPQHGTRCLASNTLLFVHICLPASVVSADCFNTKGVALLHVKTHTHMYLKIYLQLQQLGEWCIYTFKILLQMYQGPSVKFGFSTYFPIKAIVTGTVLWNSVCTSSNILII